MFGRKLHGKITGKNLTTFLGLLKTKLAGSAIPNFNLMRWKWAIEQGVKSIVTVRGGTT